MTEKTMRQLALNALDDALADSIRQRFISMTVADPVDDGGISVTLKRFKRSLLLGVDLHKQARAIVVDAFKEDPASR